MDLNKLKIMKENEALKTQLAQQTTLLRRALGVVEDCANTPLCYRENEVMMSYFWQCPFCEEATDTKDKTLIKHDEDCKILKAQALAPKIRAAFKEKVK